MHYDTIKQKVKHYALYQEYNNKHIHKPTVQPPWSHEQSSKESKRQ